MLYEFLKDYTVVDIETTGLSPRIHEIIELAAVKVRDHKIISTFSTLLSPICEISESVIALTGITNEMVKDAPSMTQITEDFLSFVGNDIVIGHNISFDMSFLRNSLPAGCFCNDYVCTRMMGARLYPQFEHHRLQDLVEAFQIPVTSAHRAEADALQTYHCYEYMCNNCTEEMLASPPPASYHEALPGRQHHGRKSHRHSHGGHAPSYILNEQEHLIDFPSTVPNDSPFADKFVVITGGFENQSRTELKRWLECMGASVKGKVSRKTDFLIVGTQDKTVVGADGLSSKQEDALALMAQGAQIEIIDELRLNEIMRCYMGDDL